MLLDDFRAERDCGQAREQCWRVVRMTDHSHRKTLTHRSDEIEIDIFVNRRVLGDAIHQPELGTALYESLARLFLVDMLCGTPFLAVYLRLLGAKIGTRVFGDGRYVTPLRSTTSDDGT